MLLFGGERGVAFHLPTYLKVAGCDSKTKGWERGRGVECQKSDCSKHPNKSPDEALRKRKNSPVFCDLSLRQGLSMWFLASVSLPLGARL